MTAEHNSQTLQKNQIKPMTIIRSTWSLYKKYFPLIIVCGIILATVGFVQRSIDELWLLVSLLSVSIIATINVIFVQYIQRHEHVAQISMQDSIKQSLPYIAPGVGISLLVLCMVFGGFLLFLIPGFIIAILYGQSFNYVVLENKSIGASLHQSQKLAKGHWGLIVRAYWSLGLPLLFIGVLISSLFRTNELAYTIVIAIYTALTAMLLPLFSYEVFTVLKKLQKSEK